MSQATLFHRHTNRPGEGTEPILGATLCEQRRTVFELQGRTYSQRLGKAVTDGNGSQCELRAREPVAATCRTLSFLSLSLIPELKLTDQGLIDEVHLRKTGLFV